MPLKTKEEILRANSVNLPDFLMAQGENLVRSGRGYRIKEHNSLFIQSNKWYWNSRSKGGNPIKFVMEYYNKTFPQAVDMLNGSSYVHSFSHRTEIKPPTQQPVRQKKEIHIEENEDCKRALAYLSRTRGLDYDMLLSLVKQGKITQDKKNNAVFRITDENNMTVGAELVGTSTDYRYKGIAEESAYGYGFEICKGKGENALFFESSIDMLSYMQMYNDELDNHRLISMVGVKPGTVEDTMKRYNTSSENVYLCVDNDTAGDNFANRLKQKYPEMHRISTIAPYKDWNEQLKKGIFEKNLDFSDLAWYNKGEDIMNITDVRNDYTSSIRKITSSSEEWEKFLRFSAHLNISENQQKHGFSSKLLIYSENPNVTECKTFAEWKSDNNSVKFGSRGIPVLTDTAKGEPVVTHVFDVSQTVNPPKSLENHITSQNENAVLEALINTYGYSDMYIESVISAIVNDEVQTANLGDEKKAMLSQSICFQLFEKFGLNMEYDYNMFDGITNMSVMDIAEIGCAMNSIASPLENLIENTIKIEAERSSEHERLHQQGRNEIYMERGSTATLPDVSTGEQSLVQTGYRNMDIYPDDEEYSYSTGGNGQVWFDENEIFGEPQDSIMADVDLGEQVVRPLHRSERASSESDRPDNGTEDENGGIYGSSEELSSNSTAQESISDGSGRTDTSRTDIRIDKNNIDETAETEKASVVFSCYEKLKKYVLSDNRIINAIENSDRGHLNLELEKVIAEKGIEIFNENISGNIGFYADFASSVKTENRINIENEITSAVDSILKSRLSEITVNGNEHTDISEQLKALKSATLDENGKIIKIIAANPNESFLNQVVTDYIDDIAADMYTKTPENSFLNDFFNNKDFHDDITNQIFTEAKESANKNAEQTTERSATENKIIGNTPYKYIPQKTYTKVSADIVEDVAAQLDEQGLKYSGVLKGDTATFTTSKSDKKNIDEIISKLTAENEKTDKEELHRYYSTHREDGAYPDNDSHINSIVFEEKQYIEEIDRSAYGYAEYSKPLSETEIDTFDLSSETDRSLIEIAAVHDNSEPFTEEKSIEDTPRKPVDSKYDSMFEALDSGAYIPVSEPRQNADPIAAMIHNAKQPEFENMKLSRDDTGYVLTADLKGLNSADNSVVLTAFGKDKSAVAEYIENHNLTVEDKQRTADRKFKNTLEQRNYKKMESLFPEIMNGEQSYQRFEGSYEPLSVEKTGKNTVSIMQTYIQNGDVMRDPDIVVSIDNEKQTVKPISYEQSGLAMYIEYNDGSAQQRDCSRFLNNWLTGMENADLNLVRAVVVHEFENKEHDICISYKDGKVADIKGDERAIADYMQKNGITLESEPTTEVENSYIEDISDFNVFEQEEQLSFLSELSDTDTVQALENSINEVHNEKATVSNSYEIRIARAENIADRVSAHISDTGAAHNNDFIYASYPDYESAAQAIAELRKELENNAELNTELFSQCPYYEREISNHMEITLDGEKYSVFNVDRLSNTVELIKADDENASVPYIMAKDNPDIEIRTERYDYIDSLVNEQSENAIDREQAVVGEQKDMFDMSYSDDEYEQYAVSNNEAIENEVDIHSDDIHKFAETFGLDEGMLKSMVELSLTEANINEFGKFDNLYNTRDKEKVQAYFDVPLVKANAKLYNKLHNALINKDFSLETKTAEKVVEEQRENDNIPVNNDKTDIETSALSEEKTKYFKITDEHLGEGGAKSKYQNNITAIKLLKKLEDEGRQATPEEQKQLSEYVGWGGLQEAFDDRIPSWNTEYYELKNLLTESEYEAARSSTMNAFYTSPVIIEAMYNALDNMGFKGGDILEPSMGVGNFFGMLPDDMRRKSNLTGVELDDISGRIARQLYPEASVAINGFEKMKFENNQFDLAIGNVPFGDISLHDTTKAYKNLKIHDYFFAKSIDKVRSGGIIAFVTSSGTMDKQDSSVRKMIAQKCDLLGAIRLPNTAFKKNAGTEVTSDIIFLQKREKPLKESELANCNWIHTGKSESGLPVNQYFADNPQMVLGTLEKSSFRDTIICKALPDSDLKSQLAEAIQNIKGTYEEPEFQPELNEKSSDILTATPDIPNYTYTLVNEKLYFRHDDNLIPLKDSEQSGIKFERRKGMCEIADTVKTLLNAQVENRPDDEIEKLQQQLNTQYDKYVAKYGYFNKIDNKNPNSLFKNDVRFPLLQSLEVIEGEKFIGKASIFTERTITPHKAVEHTDTSSEALIVSMSEKAKVDLNYMSELTGFDKDKIISELKGVIYPVPEFSYGDKIEYQTAEEYLSGNIYEKLEVAKMAAMDNPIFKDNITALEQAMPEPLTAGEITVKLGATWLDPKIIEQFMYETFNTPQYLKEFENVSYQKNPQAISIDYSDVGKGEWRIENKNSDKTNITVNNTFGTSEMNAYHLLENILNQKTSPKVYDEIQQADGTKTKVVNREETEALQLKTQLIKNAFSEWIFKDPERRERLVNQYNEKFNCIKPREYDGSHLKFSGINPEIQLREHQVNAIAHALFGGNTLFAHEVGAGKTFEMIATAMEGKRLGLHNKSMFVVPNHLTEQIATDFMKLYPNANILVAKPEDFSSHNRKKMCSKIATGNFDAVIIGHSQLIKIPVSPEREQAFINDQISEITSALEAAKEHDGERFTIKQLEKTKKKLEEKLNKLLNSTTKDSTVTFEELGVDKLFVDEAHLFKNLYISTKMSNIAGITTNDNVQKTQDLFMKCQYLDETTGNRGITFATGTPVSNSMTEIYSMMKYLQSDKLEKHGMNNFDSWAANFGETVTAGELAPEGNKYRQRTRFAKFVNIPELMNIFKQCADIKTADVLNLKVPDCTKENICVKPTPMQQSLVKSLSKRAEDVQNGLIDPSVDNMLTITNDGRKIGLDPRLIDPSIPDDRNSKLNICVNNVFQIWEETQPEKSAQLIFCDLGVPQSKEDIKKNGERFSVYDDIKQKLINKGVPENEIAFIHDAGNNEVKKAQMFAKVRSGEIRVLIGSTSKMGAGTNVQTKLIASHDLDCPWKPADMTQRAGRMIRQGNKNKHVKLFRYVTENTFDAYLFQTLEKKQSFISQIMTSKSPARVCDDVDEQALDYAEIKALCAGDPRIKERMELDIDVSKLKLLKSSYLSQKYELEDNVLKRLPQKIASAKNAINGIQADIKKLSEYTAPVDMDGQEQFTVKLGGSIFTDKTEANTALLELCTKSVNQNPDKETVIGEYKGFPIAVSFDTYEKCFKAHIKGEMTYTTDISSSQQSRNFTKLDNLFNSLATRLATVQNDLERAEANLENGKQQLDKPFEYESDLQIKEARLIALINELEESPAPIVEEEQSVSEQEQTEETAPTEITSDSEIQGDSSEHRNTNEQAVNTDNKTEMADINADSDNTSLNTNTEEAAKTEKKQEQSEEKKDEIRQNATPDVKSEEKKKSRFCLKDLHSERYAPRSHKNGNQKNEQISK